MSLCTVTMTADSLGTLWDEVVFCLAPIMFGLLWSLSVPGRVPTSGQIPGKENIVGWYLDRPSQKTQPWVSGVRAVSLITWLTPAHGFQHGVLLC